MTLYTLLNLCREYSRLGWAVHEQLHDVADGDSLEEQNSNALDMIADWLKGAAKDGVDGAQELADSIDEYLTENK